MKKVGVISIGVKAPIIKQGDDLISIASESVLSAANELNLSFSDGDVVAVTEAVVARSQGNYATIQQMAADIKQKTGGKIVGVLNPILSRNRFSMILKAISLACEKVIIQLSYPNDEVGNPLLNIDALDTALVNPYTDSFTEQEFVAKFGQPHHPFTNVDYIEYYKQICPNCEIVLSNQADNILNYTDTVIVAEIHTRARTKRILSGKGANTITLDEILTSSVDGSGYNSLYGVLGSNLATQTSVKLFPEGAQRFVDGLAERLRKATNKRIEVMVYGDGAFKDPVGGIWELADPVCAPAYTSGLLGSPNELKLKYLADTALSNLSGEQAAEQMKQLIRSKGNLSGDILAQGTTPRRITDLLASLADLTSGSGDKGTPIILIKNYFGNYAD